MKRQRKGHAIMISFPYQGHINPYTHLALKLASNGFTVTFAHLESVHSKLSEAHGSIANGKADDCDIFFEARGSGLDIRYTTISDGFPLEVDRTVHFEEYWEYMHREFPALVDEFFGKLIRLEPVLVPFLVIDTIYTWAARIANKYDVVNVSFWTQPALVFSQGYHLDLLKEKGHFQCKDKREEINYIPGVKSINTKDLIPNIKDPGLPGTIFYRLLFDMFEQAKKADFILYNTVEELEFDVLSSLNKYQPSYAVGPVNFFKDLPKNTISKSLWSESDCANWLESKTPGSVLYVSFGSFVKLNTQIIEELAYGLMLSGVNFIWVLRDGLTGNGDSIGLPIGYEDEIKEKGLIVPWCDQVKVLSNPAVGGFLTHNGWNSTMESMWCGVSMICYPMEFDQFTNRKLVVDDWKIGISLCDKETVDRIEVAEKIKSVMSDGFSSKDLRAKADEVKDVMRKAMEIDGSSQKNFDQFIVDLEVKIHAKTIAVINHDEKIPSHMHT